MNCLIHGVPLEDRIGKTGKAYKGHVVPGEGMCFGEVKKAPYSPPTPEVRERVDTPDWDEIARGKIRSLFIEAHISRNGIVPLSGSELITLDSLVEIAMTGK